MIHTHLQQQWNEVHYRHELLDLEDWRDYLLFFDVALLSKSLNLLNRFFEEDKIFRHVLLQRRQTIPQ
ncbi:hypothetical protein D3C80_1897850 [compost metagenome]